MLYGFFDQSGYDPDDPLDCLTVGGCIATPHQWNSFSTDWTEFLRKREIACFHAIDETDAIRNAGAVVIARHVKRCMALSVHVSVQDSPRHRRPPGKQASQAFYEEACIDMVWYAGREAGVAGDKIALHFAIHGDLHITRIRRRFKEFQALDPHLHSVDVADPERSTPLQAAGLVAYEAGRFHSDLDASVSEPRRYRPAMKILMDGGVNFVALEQRKAVPTRSRKFSLRSPVPASG